MTFLITSVGCIASGVNLKKGARLQLVKLIRRYNDSSLSMTPVPLHNGWSFSIGFSGTGNNVGLGLRLRPNRAFLTKKLKNEYPAAGVPPTVM